MAELNIVAGASRQRGKSRLTKHSTKVDLTPMVDLGFLLITFFIVTTTWNELKATRLVLPAEGESAVGNSTALTIIPMNDDKVFYYHGDLNEAIQKNLYGTTNFSISNGIGSIIRLKQAALRKSSKFSDSDMMLIIKPTVQANLNNVVAALNEVLINQVNHYALTDLSPEEQKYLVSKAPMK